MFSHPLAGVVTKLRNADDHLRRLEAESLAYLNSGSHAALLAESDPNNSGRSWLRFKVRQQPPLKFAAIAGDVVHNLRSALDYFVEEMVRLNGETPGFTHLYPICQTPDAFKSEVGKGRLKGVAPNAMRAVEGFQPYQVKPEARPRHPLTHLHKLSNRDKHHMLAISALNAACSWTFVDESGRVLRSDQTTEPVADGGVLAEMPTEFVIDGVKVQFQSKLSITIGFTEPEFTGFGVVGSLQNIREYIGMFMLPAFETFFDPLPDDLKVTSHGLTSPPKPVDMLILARPASAAPTAS